MSEGSNAELQAVDVSLNTIGIDGPVLVRAAVAAEAAGFSTVWLYDHLSGAVFGGSSSLDIWVALGAIAGATERIGIGSLVVNAALRHPGHIATATATMQEFCGGRFCLGLGAGAGPESRFSAEASMLGFPVADAPTRRMAVADCVAYLRALWRGDASFRGSSVGFSGVAGVAVPNPQPPIVVGANGPKMAALAGSVADGVNFHDWERDLGGLIAVSRAAASAASRPALEVSVEGPYEDEWLDPDSDVRRRLVDLGVERVMLRWNADIGLEAIERAVRRRLG